MKLITKIMLIAIIILVAILAYFYKILKSSSKDISTDAPYAVVINKNLIAIQASILIKNSTTLFTTKYPKELNDFIDTAQVAYTIVPIGSTFKFNKAIQVKNNISGFTRTYLLGEVNLFNTNKNYTVIYSWGILNDNHFQKNEDYWEFKKAPWELEKSKNIYVTN
jgi:membrane-bound acyltransferase YfiQ involved in biofilm formation